MQYLTILIITSMLIMMPFSEASAWRSKKAGPPEGHPKTSVTPEGQPEKSVPPVLAWHPQKPVTPYGDYCPKCSEYGNCDTLMGHEDAKKAMLDYYHKKELSVEIEKKRGRFIRAKILNDNGVVDVIIFDRQTGRIRSIY